MAGTVRGTILVVDDDENIRLLAQLILGRCGYDMVGSDSVQAAIDLYRQRFEQGERFAAAIFDLWIPGGIQADKAIVALRQIDPAAMVFIMSGDLENPRMRTFSDYGFSGAIAKENFQKTLPAALEEHFGPRGGTDFKSVPS